jgi:hypothetical protein
MKVALFYKPGAGERALDGAQRIRLFAEAGHDVTVGGDATEGLGVGIPEPD